MSIIRAVNVVCCEHISIHNSCLLQGSRFQMESEQISNYEMGTISKISNYFDRFYHV